MVVTTVSFVLCGVFVVWAVLAAHFLLFLIAVFLALNAWAVRRQVRAIVAEHELEQTTFGFDFSAGGPGGAETWQKVDRAAARREEKEQKRKAREREEERQIDREVDRLLDKISREGMASLTRKEKAFLMKASRRKRQVP
jgi:hypothetical protein